MILAIRHFPDRKRPCIVLEESNKAVALGTLKNKRSEKMLRKACGISENQVLGIALSNCKYSLEELICESEDKE